MNIGAQRVVSVLDELKEKLTYLSLVSPSVLGALEKDGVGTEDSASSSAVGATASSSSSASSAGFSGLIQLMSQHVRYEELYTAANTQSAPGKFAVDPHDEDVKEIIVQLRKSTRDMCRKMKGMPNAIAELRVRSSVRMRVRLCP